MPTLSQPLTCLVCIHYALLLASNLKQQKSHPVHLPSFLIGEYVCQTNILAAFAKSTLDLTWLILQGTFILLFSGERCILVTGALHNTMLSPGLTKDNMYKALRNVPQQKLKTN